jgi:ATP/maltotriose-dependent transcriptional regulator MalT
MVRAARGPRRSRQVGGNPSQLQISEATIKYHLKSILSKLGANDRTHAVTIALKRGFIEG